MNTCLFVRLLVPVLIVPCSVAIAATPPSGQVDGTNTSTSWDGPNITVPTNAPCGGLSNPGCDYYTLTVLDPGYDFDVTITVDQGAGDWDIELYKDGNQVGSSANAPGGPEVVKLISPGTYVVAAAPFAAVSAYHAVAELAHRTGGGGMDPAVPGPAPTFLNYAPSGLREPDPNYLSFAPARGESAIGSAAGEPTLGIPAKNNLVLQQTNPYLSHVMFLANLQTVRMEVDSCTSPAIGTFANKSSPTHVATLDPILQVDPATGRTISTQLSAKRSLISLSRDDGDNWTDSPQGAGINAGVDHQTVGVGPYPPTDTIRQPDPLDPSVLAYGTATYYASQDIAIAQAGLSRDGGFSWGAAVPMYNLTQCGGLHGHLQVGADGAVYVPNGSCPAGQSGFARSLDSGTTWTVHGVPGTTSADDPGMGVGRGDQVPGGRVYFGLCNGGHPAIAHSEDNGTTWSNLADVGVAHGIQNCAFATVVAGDDNRAAFAFLGTSTAGDAAYGSDPAQFDGLWYLYVAVTYDGGQTWGTSLATPGDPVQRGPICMQGTTCAGYRNLLDFNDIQMDEVGRIYVGYSDGCIGDCTTGGVSSQSDVMRIARSEPGEKGLLAQFDSLLDPTNAAPIAPYLEATLTTDPDGAGPQTAAAALKWTEPFDGGSPLTQYAIYRRENPGVYPALPLLTTDVNTRSYVDNTLVAGTDYCYQVRAINAVGESDDCFEVCAALPADLGSACVAPGVLRAEDLSGEAQDSTPIGLKRLFAGEPFLGDPLACATPAPQVLELNISTGAQLVAGNAVIAIWQRVTGADPSYAGGGTAQPDDRNMVSVRMVGATPECHLGRVTGSSLTDPLPSHGYDVGSAFPAPDCVVRADGTITVRVPVDKFGDTVPNGGLEDGIAAAGYSFGNLELRSFTSQPTATAAAPQPVLQNIAADFLPALSYTLVGNETCRPNLVPVAADDRVAVSGTTMLFDVLANDDNGGDCDTLQLASVSNGASGTATIENNQVRYTVTDPGACSDFLSYAVSDGHGNVDQGVVQIAFPLMFRSGFEDGEEAACVNK